MSNHLTSLQNPLVKGVVRLRDRRERDQTGLFLIEGERELRRAIETGQIIDTFFLCPSFQKKTLPLPPTTTQFTCSETVFRKLSYRDSPDGYLAIAPQASQSLADLESPTFLIVAEAIEKPGNLGTILRSSDAAGVDGLIVCDKCTDIYNPNVVRASMGTLFSVPVVQESTETTLIWLQKNGIAVVAATPHAKELYTSVDLTQPIAIAVGTEKEGLSPLWMEAASVQVRIPMRGIADSLNVATATTLLLYEAVRQRQQTYA